MRQEVGPAEGFTVGQRGMSVHGESLEMSLQEEQGVADFWKEGKIRNV